VIIDYKEEILQKLLRNPNIETTNHGYPDKYGVGAKFLRKWDHYLKEKEFFVKKCNLEGIKTAIDVGTGIGLLPYLLMKEGIQVEATDIGDEFEGEIYPLCWEIINLKVHPMYIYNRKPMKFPGTYDLFTATRTTFDTLATAGPAKEYLTQGTRFDWAFFFNDVFKYVKRVFIKTNNAGSGKGYDKWMRKYLYNPKFEGYGKPYRAWYIKIDREEWAKDPLSTLNNTSI
tara:strand:- start:334 stop:1020 length:687 start_codon:yes stop_codon:yes gene_type:complete